MIHTLIDKQHAILFAKALDSSPIFVKKAGHMNSEVNLNEFPLVFDLCTTRLDLSLFQQYLAHRYDKMALDYIEGQKEKVIKLDPGEILDEGVFHFRHLKTSGFCTFYTKYDWNPNERYYEDARIAAKRISNFTRIIMLDKLEDLNRNDIREQIKLDLNANIIVYLCLYDKVKDQVTEPDFGIWDDDYVCVVRQDPESGKLKEIELNSRDSDLNMYRKWREIIISKAVLIYTIEDVDKYLHSY